MVLKALSAQSHMVYASAACFHIFAFDSFSCAFYLICIAHGSNNIVHVYAFVERLDIYEKFTRQIFSSDIVLANSLCKLNNFSSLKFV